MHLVQLGSRDQQVDFIHLSSSTGCTGSQWRTINYSGRNYKSIWPWTYCTLLMFIFCWTGGDDEVYISLQHYVTYVYVHSLDFICFIFLCAALLIPGIDLCSSRILGRKFFLGGDTFILKSVPYKATIVSLKILHNPPSVIILSFLIRFYILVVVKSQ